MSYPYWFYYNDAMKCQRNQSNDFTVNKVMFNKIVSPNRRFQLI